MADTTPKFNRIAIEFMQRINDPVALTGDPPAIPSAGGSVLDSKAKVESFVNRAMFKLFNDIWASIKGDSKLFLKIFPELGREVGITTHASGYYVIDTGNVMRDSFKLLEGRLSTTYIEMVEPFLLEELLTGRNTELVPSATVPYAYESNRTIYFLPAASFNAQAVYINYIRLPLSLADGSFLTSGGTYDSPYYDHWNSKIAEIAAELFFMTSGEI